MVDIKLREQDKKDLLKYLEEYSKKITDEDIDEILSKLDKKLASLKDDKQLPDYIEKMIIQIKYLRRLLDRPKIASDKFDKIITALHYFIWADDKIPDKIPDVGYLDDSFVISHVYQEIKNNIDQHQNSFAVGLLKCCLEATASNAKMNENNPLIEWFQNQIYVDTSLDILLSEEIADFKFKLVLLSGTPGSGKTQFVKKLSEDLISKYGFETLDNGTSQQSIMKLKKNDRVLWVKHDATQVDSEAENAAEKLKELLAPDWDDTNYEREAKHRNYIIGINQGVLQRLLSLDNFGKLYKGINSEKDPRINVVDLSNRSAVDQIKMEHSFIYKICEKICDSRYWEDEPIQGNNFSYQTCYGCELSEDNICPILLNIKAIREPSVIGRFHQIFEMNHFRSGQITTYRDVLAILGNIIVGYHSHYDNVKRSCNLIRKFANGSENSDILNLSRLIYYNRAFSSEDIWSEFIDAEEIKNSSYFSGYCGPYFEENSDVGCNMTLFDPMKSTSDTLRQLDDKVFNEPERYFDALRVKSKLEKRLFNTIFSVYLNTHNSGSENVDNPEFLLYCLVRLARRRYFFEGDEPAFKLVKYKYADDYSDLIKKLKKDRSFNTNFLAGDILRALSGISGTRLRAEGLQISYKTEPGNITADIISEPVVKLILGKLPHQEYIEDYPRFLSFKLYSDSRDSNKPFAELPLDIDSWECLQRSAAGYLKKYLGTEYPKSMEGFLESLRSKIWNLRDVKLLISDVKEKLHIKRLDDRIQLR